MKQKKEIEKSPWQRRGWRLGSSSRRTSRYRGAVSSPAAVSHHHIITSSHHHIITSSHHHIITSSHRLISHHHSSHRTSRYRGAVSSPATVFVFILVNFYLVCILVLFFLCIVVLLLFYFHFGVKHLFFVFVFIFVNFYSIFILSLFHLEIFIVFWFCWLLFYFQFEATI